MFLKFSLFILCVGGGMVVVVSHYVLSCFFALLGYGGEAFFPRNRATDFSGLVFHAP